MNSTSGEGRDYKRSFVHIAQVDMTASEVCVLSCLAVKALFVIVTFIRIACSGSGGILGYMQKSVSRSFHLNIWMDLKLISNPLRQCKYYVMETLSLR